MELRDVFQKHRALLLVTQLIGGNNLCERLRNLSWLLDLLAEKAEPWRVDDLVILGENSAPFLPSSEILRAMTALKVLRPGESFSCGYKVSLLRP